MDFKHISVLLHESVETLNIKPDGIYADGTMGGGGHSTWRRGADFLTEDFNGDFRNVATN